jgi:hypothetical protein
MTNAAATRAAHDQLYPGQTPHCSRAIKNIGFPGQMLSGRARQHPLRTATTRNRENCP